MFSISLHLYSFLFCLATLATTHLEGFPLAVSKTLLVKCLKLFFSSMLSTIQPQRPTIMYYIVSHIIFSIHIVFLIKYKRGLPLPFMVQYEIKSLFLSLTWSSTSNPFLDSCLLVLARQPRWLCCWENMLFLHPPWSTPNHDEAAFWDWEGDHLIWHWSPNIHWLR